MDNAASTPLERAVYALRQPVIQERYTARAAPEIAESRSKLMECSNSPRCGAKSKRTGLPCRAPGVKKAEGVYGRCRIHGGMSTGPKTPEGKVRASHEKHGKYAKRTKDHKREVRELVHELRVEIQRMSREIKRAQRASQEQP